MAGRDIPDSAKRAYRERLKYLRKGQESFQNKEVSKAVQYYASYLKALADYFGVPENHLDPKFFDLQKDKAELLLISQVYWDLAKSYDRSPGLQNEAIRCLNQFVKFTIGFKHQHINAQMLKKYVRHGSAVNQQAFKNALSKIQVDSKNCYVATFAFGDNHHITNELRSFKTNTLANSRLGLVFIDHYYAISPKLVSFLEEHKKSGTIINQLVLRPIIILFTKLISIRGRYCSKN